MMFKRSKLNEKKKIQLTDDYKNQVCEHAYLGKKGYTIPKSILSEEDLYSLYEELKVKPESANILYGVSMDDCTFPVYRENDKKIYIPRFFGIERYGMPHRSEITKGETISLHFPKSLRDYQEKIVEIYMNYIKKPICQNSNEFGNGGILEVPCGRGKTVMALKIISLLT